MSSGQANLKNLLHVVFLTMPSAAAESAACLLKTVNHACTAESALYLTVCIVLGVDYTSAVRFSIRVARDILI